MEGPIPPSSLQPNVDTELFQRTFKNRDKVLIAIIEDLYENSWLAKAMDSSTSECITFFDVRENYSKYFDEHDNFRGDIAERTDLKANLGCLINHMLADRFIWISFGKKSTRDKYYFYSEYTKTFKCNERVPLPCCGTLYSRPIVG